MSSDTETQERKSGKLRVEQQQSACDDWWRSARYLGQVARAIQVPFRLRWSSELIVSVQGTCFYTQAHLEGTWPGKFPVILG